MNLDSSDENIYAVSTFQDHKAMPAASVAIRSLSTSQTNPIIPYRSLDFVVASWRRGRRLCFGFFRLVGFVAAD